MGDKRAVEKVRTDRSLDQRLRELEGKVRNQKMQLDWMRREGGFAPSKEISVRISRLEERVERAETDSEMHGDVAGLAVRYMEEHLKDRHGADLDRDDDPDVVNYRRLRKRLREWAEKVGLLARRRDLVSARRDENRVRHVSAA